MIRRRMNVSQTPASMVGTAQTSPTGSHAAVGQVQSHMWTFVIYDIEQCFSVYLTVDSCLSFCMSIKLKLVCALVG